jgi:hypothetical protein
MTKLINVYCDESCHLEKDTQKVMVIGGVFCPHSERMKTYKEIRAIKVEHGIKSLAEIKWNKVSKSKENFYYDLVDYFFDNPCLGFRAIFLEKSNLNHKKFKQTHDEFYYKMYYLMLKGIFESGTQYNIYLDLKDTLGYDKISKLKDICNRLKVRKEYSTELVQTVQEVRSHEVELIQLADFLIGAVSYINRDLKDNSTKTNVINRIKERTGYGLTVSTFLRESKFNLFKWEPQRECMRWD